MRGIKIIIIGICAAIGLVGRQARAQALAPEDIPFTQDVGLVKTRGDQLCVIQFQADKGSYKTYTLAIKKGKNWNREFPVIAVSPQTAGGNIEFKDIEIVGKRIYIAGNFKLAGSSKNCLIYFDRTSSANPWKGDYEISRNGTLPVVNTITLASDFLYIGGNFTKISSGSLSGEFINIAKITLNNFIPQRILLNKNNGADSTINSLEFDTTTKTMLVGGFFKKIAGVSIKGLARIFPADTSKVLDYTVAKNIIAVHKMRFIAGKLYVLGLGDTSTIGPTVFIVNGNLTRVKGSVSIYPNYFNFFTSGGLIYAQGYVKLTGLNYSLALYSFSDANPLTEAYKKFNGIYYSEGFNNDIYIAGTFKSLLYDFTFGKIVNDNQRFVGRVFADLDGDGIYSAAKDKLIPKRNVRVINSLGVNNILQTNNLGLFSFQYPITSVVYKVTVENLGELNSNIQYQFKADTTKERFVDLPLKYKSSTYSDITVRMTAATGWVTRKDTSEIYVLTVSNRGLVDVTVPKLNLNFDRVKDIKTFPAHNVTNIGSITWNDQSLTAGQEKSFLIKLTVPSTNYNTGQTVQFSTSIQGIVDANPANNSDSLNQTVTQGIQPFLKMQNPAPVSGDSFAWLNPTMGKIDYTIRFSNFGTDTTSTVVVKDTISTPDFVTYIQETGASHPFTRQVYTTPDLPDKVIVVYTFGNINLPPNPSGNSEVSAATGFISFRVGFSPALIPSGTSLRNRSSVYMDNAAPVLTNTVVAKIPVSSVIRYENATQSQIFPNPCSEILNFAKEAQGSSLKIYAMDGRLIFTTLISNEPLSLQSLNMPSGSYIYSLNSTGNKINSGVLIKN